MKRLFEPRFSWQKVSCLSLLALRLFIAVVTPTTLASGLIVVPFDYERIQEAINAASAGDEIYVKEGIYEENLIINKALALIGDGATIKGSGRGHTVQIVSSGVKLVGFHITSEVLSDGSGIYVKYSEAYISNNVVSNHSFGIRLYDAFNVVLRNNSIHNNRFNLAVWGLTIEHFIHDIDRSNTVGDKKVYYLVGVNNFSVPADAGYIGVVNSSNIFISDVSLSSNAEGVLLAYSRNCQIRNVTIFGNERGIRLLASENNSVVANNIYRSRWAGLMIDSSVGNTVLGNTVEKGIFGIFLSSSILLGRKSYGNTVEGNNVSNSFGGINLHDTYSNLIVQNHISRNSRGLIVESSDDNAVYGNRFSVNDIGVQISGSDGNSFWHNYFADNSVDVRVEDDFSSNRWNEDYPSGGNYWEDSERIDLFSQSNQNVIGSDAVADTPYVINANNVDFYPLAAPITALNVDLWDGAAFVLGFVTFSRIYDFELSLCEKSAKFSVDSRGFEDGFLRVSIPRDLLWSSSSGGWDVSLNGSAAPFEVFESVDRTYVYFNYSWGFYYVSILAEHVIEMELLGDINFDGKVDVRDLAVVSMAFGSFPSHPRWNMVADLNCDEKVDITDVVVVARNFGNRRS